MLKYFVFLFALPAALAFAAQREEKAGCRRQEPIEVSADGERAPVVRERTRFRAVDRPAVLQYRETETELRDEQRFANVRAKGTVPERLIDDPIPWSDTDVVNLPFRDGIFREGESGEVQTQVKPITPQFEFW